MKNLNPLILAGLLALVIAPFTGLRAAESTEVLSAKTQAAASSTNTPNNIRYSIFDTIEYDSGTQVLTLAFNNTYTYRYYGVPPLMYQDLIDSRSPGKFYNQQIRRQFKCRRVQPVSELQKAYTHSKGGTSCPYLLTTRSR